jgi:hypothetical protein
MPVRIAPLRTFKVFKNKKIENWEKYLPIPFSVFNFMVIGYNYRFRI